ncbi:MAG TPA: methylated-DNA--[protein]-cysteine S-methyltransferase [Thermoanaerobaculia bacterium]|nr:methylated-DNA--[protein]-cysteine S-methyltransferase [Thermoanaerobaculia bacterium]
MSDVTDTLFTDPVATPVGDLLAVVDGEGRLVALPFLEPGGAETTHATWARRLRARLEADAARCAPVRRQLEEYFAGRRRAFDLPLAPRGTAFQRATWEQLSRIPWGGAISYGELARRIGRPRGSRAVGQANGANPIPVVVPCHRVVAGDGTLGGYGGGLERKRWLLAHEGVALGG